MRTKLSLMVGASMLLAGTIFFGSPPSGRSPLPYAPDEALEDFKKAVALFEQGLYEPAIKVTLKLYRQYGGCVEWSRTFLTPKTMKKSFAGQFNPKVAPSSTRWR